MKHQDTVNNVRQLRAFDNAAKECLKEMMTPFDSTRPHDRVVGQVTSERVYTGKTVNTESSYSIGHFLTVKWALVWNGIIPKIQKKVVSDVKWLQDILNTSVKDGLYIQFEGSCSYYKLRFWFTEELHNKICEQHDLDIEI